MKHVWMICCVALLSLPAVAAAQPAKTTAIYQQEIALTRAAMESQRKVVVIENLKLDGSANENGFWQVYNAYRAEMGKVGDRRVKVIADYADAYRQGSVSDKLAAKLLDRYLAVLQDQVKVKKRFVRKFKKVLSAKQVARFYQIDNRLDLLVNMQIAAGVPLME